MNSFLQYIKAGACACCLLLLIPAFVFAQQSADTANTVTIIIRNAKNLTQDQTSEGIIYRFYGDVVLQQGETTMTCDTAFLNQEANKMEAFGNVHIVQTGGTTVSSNYLRYTGNTKQAYLQGNVALSDGKSTLWTEELNYNLNTKTGVYSQTGTLQSEGTTLTSNSGTYNVNAKDARFTGDVTVSDPQYDVISTDLGYNTETKLVTFFGASVVTSERSVLNTTSGTWDGKNEIAHFTERSSVLNADQYIEADRLDYNKRTGIGEAVGNVYALDTAMKTTLFCGFSRYNELKHEMLATMKPVLKKAAENDSIYMRADTFFVAPVPGAADSLKHRKQSEQTKQIGKGVTETTVVSRDSTTSDSAIQRYFIGFHHVLVYSDSLQAVGDSISYSQADSILRLMKNPIAWSRNSQITGDTILLFIANNQLKKLYVPNNALVVSQSGPERAKLFDQVQGKTLTGFFDSNAIRQMVVFPNAEAIYYATDEDGAYLGANQASSDRMRMYFSSGDINRIVLEQEVKQTMTPMQQVNIPSMKLDRFQWNPERRPQSVQELFLYESPAVKAPTTEEVTPNKETNVREKKKRKRK